MSEQVCFTLPGTPTAKGRPRFFNGRAVTDAKTRAAEQSILAAWLVKAGNRPPHDGPVEVEVTATFLPAKSWPKWKQFDALAGGWPHTSKPDLDNLIKVLDGLNGRAWVGSTSAMAPMPTPSNSASRLVQAQNKPFSTTSQPPRKESIMAIDFNNLLTPEQKRSLIEQRLAQFAAEAYQHELNRMTAEALGDSNLVEQADQALSQLRIAIAIHEQELGNL